MPSDFRYVQDIIVKRVLCMPPNKLTLADIRQAVDLTFNHPGRAFYPRGRPVTRA